MVAEFHYLVPGYRDRPDVRCYLEEAIATKGPVLEVACGTGRLLIPITRRGVPITGIDLSPHMLEVCRERLAQEPAGRRACAKILTADMRDFDLHATFDLVTLPVRPFQHPATVEGQCSCLAAVHRHLNAGRADHGPFQPVPASHRRGQRRPGDRFRARVHHA